jgi:hypothetical protein
MIGWHNGNSQNDACIKYASCNEWTMPNINSDVKWLGLATILKNRHRKTCFGGNKEGTRK